MPSFSVQVPNLVQMAVDAYMAPTHAAMQTAQTQEAQLRVQSEQLALQNQIGFQQDMTKIWGPGGVSSATDANVEDPSMIPKLMATATDAFARGMPQAGSQMLSGLSMLSYRQAQTQKAQVSTRGELFKELGAAAGTVQDQASEDNFIALARARGIDPAQFGIVGDFTVDGPKLPALAQAAMTRSQQLLAQDREQFHADLQTQRTFDNGIKSQRLSFAERNLQIHQAMADLAAHRESRLQTEGDRRDARAQEGLDFKKLQAEDRSYASAARVTQDDRLAAQGIFASDDRTAQLPPALQKSLASLAAQRAKIKLADQMRESGDVEWQPEDYQAALAQEMDGMARQGLFQQEASTGFFSSGGYKYNPPAATKSTTAPAQTPRTTPNVTKAPVTPLGLPQGSVFVGKASDGSGRDVWRTPEGRLKAVSP